ncbi:hypothetical protein MNKW57_30310 [Biformimicrobium ophioploci]|uniref:Uncharacterized protein n=1 Tax=Biformimicrobium ophioploci TaxID=3036711 RepID=A0ABQ6M2Y7_9GAMM|nr:hypothetical protein MNKW57_30310 [Microbulbifer sp. NKW57]
MLYGGFVQPADVADKAACVSNVDVVDLVGKAGLCHTVILPLERSGTMYDEANIQCLKQGWEVDCVAVEAQALSAAGKLLGKFVCLDFVSTGNDQVNRVVRVMV